MLVRSAVFLLIVLLSKVDAHSREHGDKLTKGDLKKHISKYVQRIIADEIPLNQLLGSPASLQHVLRTASTMLDKIQKCKPETQLQLLEFAARSLGDFQGCINATRDIADFEQFSLHTYQYVKLVYLNIAEVVKTAFECRSQSNIFEVAECIVTTIQNSGPEWEQIFDSALSLIEEVQDDTNRIVAHIKSCFGMNGTVIYKQVMPLLYNHC